MDQITGVIAPAARRWALLDRVAMLSTAAR
jgi:hypothetical protein